MKISTITEMEQPRPTVTYKQWGDGSYTVRVVAPNGQVYVHSNKNKAVLERLVRERYLAPNVTWPTTPPMTP